MSRVPLSDEETYAILAPEFTDCLGDLGDKTRELKTLKRIHKLLASDAPERYIYERPTGTDELQIVRVGGDLRIYCRLVMGVPENDTMYNVLYCFYLDPHKYATSDLERFDEVAKAHARTLKGFEEPGQVSDYLEDHNAFSAADLKARIDRA
ncbi:hypothetical protein [Natrinema thermotolerans]